MLQILNICEFTGCVLSSCSKCRLHVLSVCLLVCVVCMVLCISVKLYPPTHTHKAADRQTDGCAAVTPSLRYLWGKQTTVLSIWKSSGYILQKGRAMAAQDPVKMLTAQDQKHLKKKIIKTIAWTWSERQKSAGKQHSPHRNEWKLCSKAPLKSLKIQNIPRWHPS